MVNIHCINNLIRRYKDINRVEILLHYDKPNTIKIITSMTYEHTSSVYQKSKAGVGFFQGNEIMFAFLEFQIFFVKTAKASEIVSNRVFTENIIIQEDFKIACKTSHST